MLDLLLLAVVGANPPKKVNPKKPISNAARLRVDKSALIGKVERKLTVEGKRGKSRSPRMIAVNQESEASIPERDVELDDMILMGIAWELFRDMAADFSAAESEISSAVRKVAAGYLGEAVVKRIDNNEFAGVRYLRDKFIENAEEYVMRAMM